MRLLPALSALTLTIASALAPAAAAEQIGGDNAFSFVALGDMLITCRRTIRSSTG
jgi:hypothetical protein